MKEEFNVEQLVGEKNTPPQLPEDFDVEGFNTNLQTISGGKYKNFNEVNGLADYPNKYEDLKTKYDDLAEKSAINPYADNLVERVNAMRSEGKDYSEVARFLEVQTLDTTNLSAEDSIKRHKQFETGWRPSKVNEWFNLQYPVPDQELEEAGILTKKRDFSIDEAAIGARKALDGMKVDIKANVTDNSEAEAERELYINNMKQRTSAVVGKLSTVDISHELSKDLKYTFGFNVPKDDPRIAHIEQSVLATAVQSGIKLDALGRKQLRQMTLTAAKSVFFDDILKAVLLDASAGATEKKVKEFSNSEPVAKGKKPVVQKKETGPPVSTSQGV